MVQFYRNRVLIFSYSWDKSYHRS